MAKIIKANGEVIETEPKNGKYFQLEELRDVVKGYIEIVRLRDGFMIVNEEGKLMGLPINTKATEMAHETIVGDVLVCDRSQIN